MCKQFSYTGIFGTVPLYVSFLLMTPLQRSFAFEYAPEVNGLRDRERTYVAEALRQKGMLNQYEVSWNRVEASIRRIVNTSDLSSSALKSTRFDPGTRESSKEILQSIAHEAAIVSIAQFSLRSSLPELKLLLDELDRSANQFPDLVESQKKVRSQLEARLMGIDQALRNRNEVIKASVQSWLDWELEAHRRGIVDSRKALVSELEFSELLSQIQEPLIRGENEVSRSLESADGFEHAEETLAGMIWLRSQVPAFLAGRITTPERIERVNQLTRLAEQQEDKLKNLISRFRALRAQVQIASTSAESLRPRVRYAAGALGSGMAATPAGFQEVPRNQPLSPSIEWRERLDNQGEVKVQRSERINKKVLEFEGLSVAHAELMHGGYLQVDDKHIPLPFPKRERLASQLKTEVSIKVSNQKPIPSKPRGEVKDTLGRLEKMVKNAHQSSTNPDEQNELAELKNEVDRFKKQTEHLDNLIEEGVSNAKAARDRSQEALKQLADAAAAQSKNPLPPVPTGRFSAQAEAAELAKTIADLGLSLSPAGNVYNMGNFVSSVLLNTNLLGQPTGPTDQLLFAIGSIAPFIPSLTRAARATIFVGCWSKSGRLPVGIPIKDLGKIRKFLSSAEMASPKAKAFGMRQALNFSEKSAEDLERIAKSYTHLENGIKTAPVKSWRGTVWRGKKATDVKPGENLVDDIFNDDSLAKNHRYSMPGDSALYSSVGTEQAARTTIEAELRVAGSGQEVVIASKEVDLKRVLDLTDKSTLEKLGLHEGDLILKKEKLANAYDIPQQIGNIAQEMGFEGILVESAALDDGYNLVIFPKRQ